MVEKRCGFQKEVLWARVRIRVASRELVPDGLLTRSHLPLLSSPSLSRLVLRYWQAVSNVCKGQGFAILPDQMASHFYCLHRPVKRRIDRSVNISRFNRMDWIAAQGMVWRNGTA